MKFKLFMGLAVACLSAYAQPTFEVQPFVGTMYGGTVPVSSTTANLTGINKIALDSSISYGITAGVNFGAIGLEFLWNQQKTQATGKLIGGGSFPQKYDVNNNQYHGNFLFHFTDEDHRFRPYALVGFGATNSSGNNDSVTKFSYGIGGGVKYYFSDRWGIRAQARYAPTYLYTNAGGLWCNWWGYCWVVGDDHYLNQGDFTVGLTFRFGR